MYSLSEIYNNIENPLNNSDNLKKAVMECLKTYYAGTGEGFYERMIRLNGREDNSKTNQSDKEKFLIKTTEEWRINCKNIYSSMSNEQIESDRNKEAIKYILSLDKVETIEQKHEIYTRLEEMNAKSLYWENHEGGWNHIMSNKIFLDKSKNIVPKVTHRLYIACKKTDLFNMMDILKDKCSDTEMPYYFKTMETEHRDDSIVIYSDTENLPNYLRVLENIKNECPDLISNFDKPPAMTGILNNWIGLGDEPITEKGNKEQSYSLKRAEIMFKAIYDSVEQEVKKLQGKKIILEGKEVSFNKELVNSFTDSYIENCRKLSPERLEYVYEITTEDLSNREMIKQGIKNNMSSLMGKIFKHSNISPKIKLPNGKITNYKMEVARETMSSLIPLIEKFDPSFMNKVRESIEREAIKEGIDTKKFCFDIGTREKFEIEDKKREDEQPKMKVKGNENKKLESMEHQPEVERRKVTKDRLRSGTIELYDDKENIIVQDYINPDLMKGKVVLPNGNQISKKQYIQEIVAPRIPESGTFKLKNGIEISARQFIEEYVMFEGQTKYKGDIDALLNDTVDSGDVPPTTDGKGVGMKQEHGYGIQNEEKQIDENSTEKEIITGEELKGTLRKSLVTAKEVKEQQTQLKDDKAIKEYKSLRFRKTLGSITQEEQAKMNELLNIQAVQLYDAEVNQRRQSSKQNGQNQNSKGIGR